MQNLSIVIPVYNEEKGLPATLDFFEKLTGDHPAVEVIFVDDASTDRSPEVLAGRRNPAIKVVRHKENKGYGAALKSGLNRARYDYFAITDADGSYPCDRIPALFDRLLQEDAAMIVGRRTGDALDPGLFRKLGKRMLRGMAERLSREPIPDFNSGLRIARTALVRKAQPYLPDGFSFTTTLTLYMLSTAQPIVYEPIDYRQREGKSKIRPVRDFLNFLQLIIRTIMFFNPLRVFLPLSLLFMALAVVVGVVSSLLGKVMDITAVVLFVTGIQLFALGLLADLIDKRLGK
ncbi:MAG TPA: glycosyltransferase family 2 protein [Candidatus Bathyarchaeia archaeon]|nr:glycosyltransferase family 2 protein [Candidatus Bathyarchaeia archaeon]